ncbi:hypothetical protein EGP64_01835 [bacterium]|nr:hypothetical protein [bacterium]
MKNKARRILPILLVVLFILLFFCLKDIYQSLKKDTTVKTLDSIENYNYTLNENDSEYFKKEFKNLKKILESDSIVEEEYASALSKLFTIDFYSLNDAISKSDVGGIQFVYDEYRDSFLTKAKDTIYNYVESNLYGKRTQELPEVKEVEVTNIEKKEYDGEKEQDDEAYYVDVTITYEKDLDYPTECSFIWIHHNNKLELVEME